MRISSIVAFFFLLTGCSNAHKDTFTLTAKSPDKIWSLAGKVSVKYNSGAFTSRFRWKQDRHSSEILFKNSFGQYVKVTIKKGLFVLENSKGSTIKNDSLKSLMIEELGWFFPLDSLSSWIGRLISTNEKLRNHSAYKEVFSGHKEWKMVIEEFVPSSNLPRKLRFASDEAEIKLIIKEWGLENGKID
tara:strand:- start:250 stop:813 length:564 start_codon:yes stop_codon:yes gene_type:complete